MGGNNQKVVVLQPRDMKLLDGLYEMGIIDRELAKTIGGFGSTTRANARLLSLTQAGFLRRIFVGTIPGGRKAIYKLSRMGVAIASAANGREPDRAVKGPSSELFLDHKMHINQIYIQVKHKPIPRANCRFRRWINFTRVISKVSPVIPDGYFELQCESEIKAVFLEVDMGTESLRTWEKKIGGYLRFAVAGEFKRLFGVDQFRVIVVANSDRRAENIRRVAGTITDKIFRFTSFEIINREGFWSAIWQKPVGAQRESLL